MVKKLLRHEFIYYVRSFGMFFPIVLAIGGMTRIFRFFDNGGIISNIAIASSCLMLFVACAALLLIASIMSVVRFYKNMYTSEGYLTFTLPVTNKEHIFVKLFASWVFRTACWITVIFTASLALSGSLFSDIAKILSRTINAFVQSNGTVNCIIFAIEIFILIILSSVSTMLLYYACITIGQTAKKNRILMAFVAYFVYYMATQTISTAITIVVSVLGASGALKGIATWIEHNYTTVMHIYFIGAIILFTAMSAAFWFVTQTIMTKKLNLE